MTTAKISGNVSGTGSVTLAAPNTNSNYTLTLPTVTSTVVAVDPGTVGNVLTSNGTTWTSAAAPTPTAATQAQMETATDNTTMATPLNANWHPGVAKAWVKFNASGTVAASHNITSITDNAIGDWTVNIATDFSSANYCGTALSGMSTPFPLIIGCSAIAAGTFRLRTINYAGVDDDPNTPNAIFATFFGDQ